MRPLPRSDHVTPADSRPWLLFALVVAVSADAIIILTRSSSTGTAGWYLLRMIAPAAVLGAMLAVRRVSRLDVGLAAGRPGVTLLWIAVPAAWAAAVSVVLGIVFILVVRAAKAQVPLDPTEIGDASQAWDYLLEGCLLAPVMEETLYRGLLVGALDRPGRRWIAIVGSGVGFVLLHLLYRRPPIAAVEYGGAGMLMAWAFLRSRSLLAPIALHALGNGVVLLKDLAILEHREACLRLLGIE